VPRNRGAVDRAASAARRGALAPVALFVLLGPAVPVWSDGGGDYPPPSSGDWVITQDTWVENETIYLGGDLTVLGANLTLDNVTLRGNLTGALQTVTVAEGARLSARNCRFVVGIASNLSFELSGGTDIRGCAFDRSGGSVWVRLSSSSAVFSGCRLQGTLSIADGLSPVLDGTTVSDSETGVFFGAGVRLAHLTVRNCTQGAIGGPYSSIADCTFIGSVDTPGLGLHPGHHTNVQDCTFKDCDIGINCGYFHGLGPSSDVNIVDCFFNECGLSVNCGPNASVQSCTLKSVFGLTGFDITMHVEDCDFIRADVASIWAVGMQVGPDSSILVRNCTFRDLNWSMDMSTFGPCNATVENSIFIGDKDASILLDSGWLSVQNCTFMPSIASDYCIVVRGALDTRRRDFRLDNSTFQVASNALTCGNISNGSVSRCEFIGPEKPDGREAAIVVCGGSIDIRDSRIQGGNRLQIYVSGGICRALNLSFQSELVSVEPGASFGVGWYLDATIRYLNSTPADGAILSISNRTGKLLSSIQSGPDGRIPRQEITEHIREWNRTTYFTPHSLSASKDGLFRNLTVNLNRNLDLTLKLGDVNAPSVEFASPANNTLLNRTSVRFEGTASDDRGVSSVRLRAGAGAWVVAGGTSEWNATLDLLEGANQITVEAADASGNTARALLTVRVDTVPPAVNITYPPAGTLVNTTTIELTGRTEPGCTVTVNGETVPFYLGQFSAEVPLQEGRNNLTVAARDAAGNVGRARVSVDRDTIPPALAVTSPRNGEVTGRAVVTVSGTVEPGARLFIGEAGVAPEGPFFSLQLMLREGVNTIEVRAVDGAGNRATASVRVILDRTPPTVTVDLKNGTVVRSADLVLRGSTEPGATLSVNGAPVAVAPDGNFSFGLSLRPGPNTIHIEAADAAGNLASLDRSVTFEEPARPRPPAEPETDRGSDTAVYVVLAVVIALTALFIGVLAARRPPSAGDEGESGPRPPGEGP